MYSMPTKAPTPTAPQNRLSARMKTSAHRLSSSADTTRSSSTIGPECGTSRRISGMSIFTFLRSFKHQSRVGAAESERIAHGPAQRPPETAARLHQVQRRQVRIGDAVPQMPQHPSAWYVVLHPPPASAG